MALFTVAAVSSSVDTYQTQYGDMKAYKVKFQEMGDTIVTIAQKPETAAPKPGERLEGSVDMSGKYGPKFKKEFKPKPVTGTPFSNSALQANTPDSSTLRATAAIRSAVALYTGIRGVLPDDTNPALSEIENYAKAIYDMVDRVKDQPKDDFSQAMTTAFGEGVETVAGEFGIPDGF